MEKMNLSNDQISAVINGFVMFTMNFPYKWYDECFEGWEREHFGKKWEMWAEKYSPECAFLRLWCSMDDLHRAILTAFIMREQREMYKISCLNK